MTQLAKEAAKLIQDRYPNFKPKIAIILGSGLGGLADTMTESLIIDYAELPGFPRIAVEGHAGQLCLGYLHSVPVVFLKGRKHPYEGDYADCIKTYIRTLKCLGVEILLATNAAGSLRAEMSIGELVLIKDHINFQPGNPLTGPNDDDFGPRFLPMNDAYDEFLQSQLLASAKANSITLHQGIYLSVLGPNYETAAEIQAFRLLGADVVGMSTVAEILVARHCGLRCAVISMVTNLATGLSHIPHDHSSVLASAEKSAATLSTLINAFIEKQAHGSQ